MYGPDSSYPKSEIDRRKNEFRREREKSLEQKKLKPILDAIGKLQEEVEASKARIDVLMDYNRILQEISDIIEITEELNMANYTEDQVEKLNDSMIRISSLIFNKKEIE